MREAGGGRIVCVTSVAGVYGVPGESVYCASTYAVEGLAQSLALLKTQQVDPQFPMKMVPMHYDASRTKNVKHEVPVHYMDAATGDPVKDKPGLIKIRGLKKHGSHTSRV